MEMAPHVKEIADDLVQQAVSRGDVVDVMDDLAGPLPTIVIAEMLGVSTEDRGKFKRWSTTVTEPFRPETTMEEAQARIAELNEFTEYLKREIAKRRERPTEDLIGRLVAARDQSDSLSEEELLSFIRLLLVAGNETTTNLIGNAVLALTDHPREQARLRQNPDMIDSAIEEFLRYDGSVQFTSRLSTEPVEMHGRKLDAGTSFVTVLASANRDEDVWENPDDLVLDRQQNRHLAFGDWIHVCIGQHLARLETRTSIPALLNALPRLELAVPRDKLIYRPQFNLRGLSHLPVRNAV
jgi:cytochrome P450